MKRCVMYDVCHHVTQKPRLFSYLRKLILGDTLNVSDMWKISEDVLQRLEKERNDVIKHLAGIEDEINTAADKLIAAIFSVTERNCCQKLGRSD